MVRLKDFNPINAFEWEIPTGYRPEMNTSVRVVADRRLLEGALDDQSLEQALNATMLPGLAGPVMVMPDVHQGYGFPIGGVAAFRYPEGVVSPGAIGYDINCGVRLLSSQILYEEVQEWLPFLASVLNQYCPSGVGAKGKINLSRHDLDLVCSQGSHWALKKGFATDMDIVRTEENGSLSELCLCQPPITYPFRPRGI